jgi:hypothetical protein
MEGGWGRGGGGERILTEKEGCLKLCLHKALRIEKRVAVELQAGETLRKKYNRAKKSMV